MTSPGTTGGTTAAPAGHDEALAAKFDSVQAAAVTAAGGATTSAPEAHVKPEGVPDKFWNAETGVVDIASLAKSYTELEKTRGAAPQVPPAASTPDATVVPPAGTAEAAVGADAFAAYSAEYAEKGVLSSETYAAIEAKGISKAMVDSHIAGVQAQNELVQMQAFALVGGQQQYSAMLGWAEKNMTDAEVQAFDKSVLSNDPALRSQAIMGLKANFEKSHGSSQAGLVNGAPAGGVAGFASQAEMTTAMKDPRYQNDPAYRASVAQRLEATTAF